MQKIPRGFFPGNSFHPEQSLVFPLSRFQRMLGLGGGVEVMRDLNIFSDGNSFKIRHRLESLCYYQFIFSICIFLWFLCDVTLWVWRRHPMGVAARRVSGLSCQSCQNFYLYYFFLCVFAVIKLFKKLFFLFS